MMPILLKPDMKSLANFSNFFNAACLLALTIMVCYEF